MPAFTPEEFSGLCEEIEASDEVWVTSGGIVISLKKYEMLDYRWLWALVNYIYTKLHDDEVPDKLEIPSLTIPDLLKNAAERHPQQTALVFLGARLSYEGLKRQVDKLAAGLHALGIDQGDRVAIMMPNCPQAVIAYYATLSLGAVTVMTNPLYVERELEHQWGDSDVTLVVPVRRESYKCTSSESVESTEYPRRELVIQQRSEHSSGHWLGKWRGLYR